MDPLSITVSAITILVTVKKSLEYLKKLRRKSQGLDVLIQETTDLGLVLRHVEAFLRTPQTCDQDGANTQSIELSLLQILERARSTLIEIDNIVQGIGPSNGSSPQRKSLLRGVGSADHSAYAKGVSQLTIKRQELQTVKYNLNIVLSIITSFRSSCIENVVHQLLTTIEESGASHQHFQRLALNAFLSQDQLMQNIRGEIQVMSEKLNLQTLDYLNARSTHLLLMDNSSHNDAVARSGTDERSLQAEPVKQNLDNGHIRRMSRNNRRNQARENCDWGCNCSCHTRRSITTSECLSPIVGNLSMNVRVPSIKSPCNRASCRRKSPAMVQIDYLFPPWMLMAMISTTIVVRSLQSCNITLRACRVVPDSAIIFRYALDGNLQGIKILFDAGTASAYDVDASTRTSALVYATDRGHIDLWRFLLEAGADPCQETNTRHSPMDVACGRILGGTVSAKVTAALREDFDIEEYLEERQMPVLHKVVLSLAEADLETQLRLSTRAELDALDYQGRTALSWAAIRGDTASLNLLLKHGADPNVVAHNEDSPLHYATRAPNPGCVRPLVDSGADINAVNAWNVNPLTYTTAFRDDVRYLEPLLEKNVDVDHKDKHGRSALMRAVLNNRPNLVKCLLQNGAKLSEADTWGSQPLMVAIERKFHAVAHIILENGSSTLTEAQFSSVLGMATTSGDYQAVEMLEKLQSRLIDAEGEQNEASLAESNVPEECGVENVTSLTSHAMQARSRLNKSQDVMQAPQNARARTTSFEALESSKLTLAFRKGKAKAP